MSHRNGAVRPEPLAFRILGQQIQIDCGDEALAALVRHNYGSASAGAQTRRADLRYALAADAASGTFEWSREGAERHCTDDLAGLAFELEKDLTIALQERRPDLLFLHAAALESGGRAVLLAGESGAGKSTTAWALLHNGLRYLSDELAPVALHPLEVHAYPHALCLKRPPPPSAIPWAPTDDVLDLGATLHVRAQALPASPAPCPLGAVCFVQRAAPGAAPSMRRLGAAEVAARLYVHVLNALAHADHGLAPTVRIAKTVPGCLLEAGDLDATCALLLAWLPQLERRREPRLNA